MKKEICFYGSDVNLLSGCIVYYDSFIKRKKEISQDDIHELNLLSLLEEKACFHQPFVFSFSYAWVVLRALRCYETHCEVLDWDLVSKCKSLGLIITDMVEYDSE